MSAEPATLLEAARAIVAEQNARLRSLLQSAQQRAATIEGEARQAERSLDEVQLQLRFAMERGQTTTDGLQERERQAKLTFEAITQEQQQLRHSLRQLDQLIRQIEMSSSTLRSQTADADAADPWVQALRSQVIMGREEERLRLAREVHDGPAQVLANSLMGIERCRTLLGNQQVDRLAQVLDQLGENNREGLAEVRRFIADLRPGKLEEQGLVAALSDYVRRYHDSINPRITFDAERLPRLPTEAEIVLYRIVQEALQNAHKHSRGAPVHVVIAKRQESVVLTVRDEGNGFDPREVLRRTGRESWGLTSMRERAELIGAKLTVSTKIGHGTEVAVVLPFTP